LKKIKNKNKEVGITSLYGMFNQIDWICCYVKSNYDDLFFTSPRYEKKPASYGQIAGNKVFREKLLLPNRRKLMKLKFRLTKDKRLAHTLPNFSIILK